MSFNDVDVAYCAGLFEGEGSVYAVAYYWSGGEKRSRKTPQLKIRIAMTDREPLERVQEVFGGLIHGPYIQREGVKPQWIYALEQQIPARAMIDAIYPYLSPRRQGQVDRALGARVVAA